MIAASSIDSLYCDDQSQPAMLRLMPLQAEFSIQSVETLDLMQAQTKDENVSIYFFPGAPVYQSVVERVFDTAAPGISLHGLRDAVKLLVGLASLDQGKYARRRKRGRSGAEQSRAE